MNRRVASLSLLVLAACAQSPTPNNQNPAPAEPVLEITWGISGHASGVYAVGTTNDSDGIPEGRFAAFIRKYEANGKLTWGKVFGIPGDEYAAAVATDAANNAYVAGVSASSVPGPQSLSDVFLRKFTPSGDVAWVRQFGSPAFDHVDAVAAVGDNAVYVVGYTEGDLAGSRGGTDAFIRKYDALGGVAWTSQFGTQGVDVAYDVAVDDGGNAYVVGLASGPLDGSDSERGTTFIRRYNTDGKVAWTRQLDYGAFQTFSRVAVSNDDVYVGFGYQLLPNTENNDIRIVKFGTDGTQAEGWLADYDPAGNDDLWDMSADSDGNVYFAGRTESGTSAGRRDYSSGLVVKLDPNGEIVWDEKVGSSGSDVALAVVARTPSEVYGAGATREGLEPRENSSNAFVRRLDGTDGGTVWTD